MIRSTGNAIWALILWAGLALAATAADPLADTVGRLSCYRDAAMRGLAVADPTADVTSRPPPTLAPTWNVGQCRTVLAWAAEAGADVAVADARLRGLPARRSVLVPRLKEEATVVEATTATLAVLLDLLANADVSLRTPLDTALHRGVAAPPAAIDLATGHLIAMGSDAWLLPAGASGRFAPSPLRLLAVPEQAVTGLPALRPWSLPSGHEATLGSEPVAWSATPVAGRAHIVSLELVLTEPRQVRLELTDAVAAWWNARPLLRESDGIAPAIDLHLLGGVHRLTVAVPSGVVPTVVFVVSAPPEPEALAALATRAGLPVDLEAAVMAERLLADIGERSRSCPTIEPPAAPIDGPVWPIRNRCGAPLWLRQRVAAEVVDGWQPSAEGWFPDVTGAVELVQPSDLSWQAGWRMEDLYGMIFYAETAQTTFKRLFGEHRGGVVLGTVLANDRLRLLHGRAQGTTVRMWVSGHELAADQVFRLQPGRHPVLFLTAFPKRLPPHLAGRIVLDLGFDQVGRVDDLDAAWVQRVTMRESLLRWVENRLDGDDPHRTRVRACLDALAESRIQEGR